MTAETVFRGVKVGKTVVTLEARPRRTPDAKPSRTLKVTVDVRKLPPGGDAGPRDAPATQPGR